MQSLTSHELLSKLLTFVGVSLENFLLLSRTNLYRHQNVTENSALPIQDLLKHKVKLPRLFPFLWADSIFQNWTQEHDLSTVADG